MLVIVTTDNKNRIFFMGQTFYLTPESSVFPKNRECHPPATSAVRRIPIALCAGVAMPDTWPPPAMPLFHDHLPEAMVG